MNFEVRVMKKIPFSDIKIGDVFKYENQIFMRISSAILNDKDIRFKYTNAVNLSYPRVAYFKDDAEVTILRGVTLSYERDA